MINTIILNGPPASGKDHLGSALARRLGGKLLTFKRELYSQTAIRLGIDLENFISLASNRGSKDKKIIKGLCINEMISPREAMIHVAESIIKPAHGSDYFGITVANKLEQGYNIVTDGGFVGEILPVIEASDRTVLAHVYREGCSFDGDSRDYILMIHPKLTTIKYVNDKEIS